MTLLESIPVHQIHSLEPPSQVYADGVIYHAVTIVHPLNYPPTNHLVRCLYLFETKELARDFHVQILEKLGAFKEGSWFEKAHC